ncbi:DUF3667 domain-containing protein [Dinghuibacter silviterrae]|uniref:Uncharacterized protein DUF3667 n=1 Tax=Dinghuibacter silviterrae TaxID=1539049 RepID=A0A4R8DV69_9BACT|nr:DUF3667 domain-containing protein [Dinghuibacter silviterrae]TDX01896.1 uncharacterized protein DUF3667 [Dinghuibacter silviterrae]
MPTCLNCQHRFEGNYCNHCGEKVYTEHDKSVWHFFEEGLHFITHFEGKFFTTLKAVLTRPGKLSEEYCLGIRKKYFKPLSFFLLLVVVYLLFPLAEGLNMRMTYYPGSVPYTGKLLQAQIDHKMAARGLTEDQLSERFADKSEKLSKIMLLTTIPLCGLVLWVLFIGLKRPLFDHLVIATEVNAVFVLVIFLLLPLLGHIIGWLLHRPVPGAIDPREQQRQLWLYYAVIFAYSTFAFRRFYRAPWWRILPSAVAFTYLHGVIIFVIYRFLLFETTSSLL